MWMSSQAKNEMSFNLWMNKLYVYPMEIFSVIEGNQVSQSQAEKQDV